MLITLQEYFAQATRGAAKDMIDAAFLLPEEKRVWKPLGKGRSALDQIAECALFNQNTVTMLQMHRSPITNAADWMKEKDRLAESWKAATALLRSSADDVAEAILAVSDDHLAVEIPLPWGPFTVQQAMAYPFWNMSYHQGQIVYLGSLC